MERRLSIKERIALMQGDQSTETGENNPNTSNSASPARIVGKLKLEKYNTPIPAAAESAEPATDAENTPTDDSAHPDCKDTRRPSVKDRVAAMMKAKEVEKEESVETLDGAKNVPEEKKLSVADRVALYKTNSFRSEGTRSSPKRDEASLSPETVSTVDDGGQDGEHMSVARRLAEMRKKEKKDIEKPAAEEKRPSAVAERIAAIEPPKPPSPKAAAEPRKPASSIAERMALFKAKEHTEEKPPLRGKLHRRASTGTSSMTGSKPPPVEASVLTPSPPGRVLSRRASTGTNALPADFATGGMSIAERIAAMNKKSSTDDSEVTSKHSTTKSEVSKLKRTSTGELEVFNSTESEQPAAEDDAGAMAPSAGESDVQLG